MPVVQVDEVWQDRTATEDAKAVRAYVRRFRVYTDDPATGQLAVKSAKGLPQRFDVYQDPDGAFVDTNAIAYAIDIKQGDQPTVWDVTVEYSNKCDLPSLGDWDPTARPAEVEWGCEKFSKPVQFAVTDLQGHKPGDPILDIFGNPTGKFYPNIPIVNSAGEAFDPPPEIDDSRPTLTITRIENSFSQAKAWDYKDAVNSDSFMGADPGTWKVDSITARRHYENNQFYWQVTYVFHFRAEGWNLKPLDQGFYALDTNGKRYQILDKFAQPLQSPVPLDGKGNPLDMTTNPRPVPVYLEFAVYKTAKYGDLNLP